MTDTKQKLIDAREAAELLGCSPNHLRTLGLPTIRLGRLVRYRWKDIDGLINDAARWGNYDH